MAGADAHRDDMAGSAAPATAEELPAPVPPLCIRVSSLLWFVIGVLTLAALVGVAVIAASFYLQKGYRGARLLLTVVTALGWGLLGTVLVQAGPGATPGSTELLILIAAALLATAGTLLMWLPDADAYLKAVHAYRP